ALARLQQQGKVRWIGVSNFNVPQMQAAMKIAPITSLQPPYSLIRREAEPEILPFCRKQGIGVIAYSPMGSGLLTGTMTRQRLASLPETDFRRTRAISFQEPRLSRNLAIAEKVKAVAARLGRAPGEVAIAWVLANPAVTGAIVGARSASQAEGVMRAANIKLSEQDLRYLSADPEETT
ncbi:MAG: aldo/keto reductase, partial [Phycisphaerae bacterium]|nr:aldo/keto reductase [Phycisphaerae bacterium]